MIFFFHFEDFLGGRQARILYRFEDPKKVPVFCLKSATNQSPFRQTMQLFVNRPFLGFQPTVWLNLKNPSTASLTSLQNVCFGHSGKISCKKSLNLWPVPSFVQQTNQVPNMRQFYITYHVQRFYMYIQIWETEIDIK